jgi:hypothetical protein
MEEKTYIIRFNDISLADANRYAEELRNTLLDASRSVKVNRRREDPNTQDFGATLVLILGAPAVVAAAKALGNWLQLRNSASVTLEDADGKIIAKNITGKDAAKLTELFIDKK